MRVWLVNPFDPLPGEAEQRGRYGELVHCLRAAGHEVVWFSCLFSHRFKRDVDAAVVQRAAAAQGIAVHLLPAPHYTGNVSLRRLWSHRAFGRRFRALAEGQARPDLILASSPPLASACEAARLGARWRVPTVIDIQDQWPDAFLRVLPRPLRCPGRWLLRPLYATERKAYRRATAIVGVAQGYVDRGIAVGGAKRHTGVFPLGVSLADLRDAVGRATAAQRARWEKPDGQIWMLYSGSLSHNYDFLTIIRAAALARRRYGSRVRFILTGTGELADAARDLVRRDGLDNVCITGFLDFPEWAWLLSQADVGFNASFPDALIYLPNKIFSYLAAGAAVLNTIPGQCAEIVASSGCGLNYTAGDVQSCFEAVCRLVDAPDELAAMRSAARRLAEETFDRPIVYGAFVRFLERVATDTPVSS